MAKKQPKESSENELRNAGIQSYPEVTTKPIEEGIAINRAVLLKGRRSRRKRADDNRQASGSICCTDRSNDKEKGTGNRAAEERISRK